MADPRATVPYHDPHDDTTTEHLLQLLHIENPTLADLYPTDDPNPQLGHRFDHQIHSSTNEIGDPSHPIHDPIVWSMVGAGSSNGANGAALEPNFILDNGKSLTVWPEPPMPSSCSYCNVLREIIHTDGNNTTKLELHGRVGIISHAILEYHGMHFGQQYQMFDFCKKNIEDVKEFLKWYFNESRQAGFIVMPDPLSNFYDALCIGLVRDNGFYDDADDFLDSSIASSGSGNEEPLTPTPDPPEPDSSNKWKSPNPNKPSLSIQRVRSGRMTLLELAAYFHLPIEEAARRMSICPTVIKRICRRGRLERWPYRKIKSIDCRILDLKKSYALSSSVGEMQYFLGEIKKEQRSIDEICFGVARAP